ncbi:unnamed protein product, partial [Mesorhabditis spiculigera]
MMNDYIVFRLLMDEAEKSKAKHMQHRASLIPPAAYLAQHRASITSTVEPPAVVEPFCSPLVPHVPIRERLARRGTSVDVADDVLPGGSSYCNSFYGAPRRRRMSLLQTLRLQNRQLNDSGFDMHRERTASESTNRDTCSPPAAKSPPQSPSKKALASLKAKIFGKKEKRLDSRQSSNTIAADLAHDGNGGGRSRKSPSTTNDSGRGSQGQLEERVGDAIPDSHRQERKRLRIRTTSCPCLLGLCELPNRHSDSEEDGADDDELFTERMLRNSSPVTAADCLLERRLLRRAIEVERRRLQEATTSSTNGSSTTPSSHRPRATIAIAESFSELSAAFVEPSKCAMLRRLHDKSLSVSHDSGRRPFDVTADMHCPPMEDILSIASMAATEDLCDYDDSSTLLLDHYLPLSRNGS